MNLNNYTKNQLACFLAENDFYYAVEPGPNYRDRRHCSEFRVKPYPVYHYPNNSCSKQCIELPPNCFKKPLSPSEKAQTTLTNDITLFKALIDMPAFTVVGTPPGLTTIISPVDVFDPHYATNIVGITLKPVLENGTVPVLQRGELSRPEWTFDTLRPVFAGPNGSMVQLPDEGSYSFVTEIARPLSMNLIYVDVEDTVLTPLDC